MCQRPLSHKNVGGGVPSQGEVQDLQDLTVIAHNQLEVSLLVAHNHVHAQHMVHSLVLDELLDCDYLLETELVLSI